jgi:protease YdgD
MALMSIWGIWRSACVLLPVLLGASSPASGEEQLGVPDPRWGAFFSGKDQRVPMEPTVWPWHAIGRVNVADSVTRRHCTGTLVGERLVLTAGHCLFDHRLGRWVKPENVHFVAGQARDTAAGHSKAEELIVSPKFDASGGTDPARRTIRMDLVAHDWALVRLQTALAVKPVPVRAFSDDALVREVAAGEIARAGYSVDRRYLLSVHRGCSAALSQRLPGAMLNRCDARPGDSGSPLLLLQGDEAFLIGLSAGAAHEKRPDAGYVAVMGFGPSAASFIDALIRTRDPQR